MIYRIALCNNLERSETVKGHFSYETPLQDQYLENDSIYRLKTNYNDRELILLLPRSNGSTFQGLLRSRKLLIHKQVVISRKWYKTGSQLQWKTNRKLYAICRKALLLMTLKYLEGHLAV